MKALVLIFSLLGINTFTNAQIGYYVFGGINVTTHHVGGAYGLGITYKKQFISISYYQFAPILDDLPGPEEPNMVVKYNMWQYEYGFLLPIDGERNLFIVPSIGFGQNYGTWRTDKNIQQAFFTDYEEIDYSGLSFTPKLEFLFRTKYLGLGAGYMGNLMFNQSRYNTNILFLRLLVGRLNQSGK